jgi:chitinase
MFDSRIADEEMIGAAKLLRAMKSPHCGLLTWSQEWSQYRDCKGRAWQPWH